MYVLLLIVFNWPVRMRTKQYLTTTAAETASANTQMVKRPLNPARPPQPHPQQYNSNNQLLVNVELPAKRERSDSLFSDNHDSNSEDKAADYESI